MKSYITLLNIILLFITSNIFAQGSQCIDGEVKINSIVYDSIQSAVSASEDGDTITIGSGSFSEKVRVIGKNNLIILSNCFPEIKKIAVRNVDGFLLKGLSIRTTDDVKGSSLRLTNVQNARIENSHIFNSANKGVEVDGGSLNILFSGVFVYNNDEGFLLEDGVGVIIRDSRVYGNRGNGIFIRNVSSLIIEDTEVYNNARKGIVTYHEERLPLQSNGFIGLTRLRVYSNGQEGISLRSHHGWRVSSSEIMMNGGDGIHINKLASALSGGDILDENYISRNGGHGVYLKSNENIELTKNEITNHESGYGFFYEAGEMIGEILLKENIVRENNGFLVLPSTHSQDLSSYDLYLDNEDTGNQTTLNGENALGIGNYRPQAIAGEDVLFLAGERVSLSAKDSYDWDGDTLSYTWALLSQPSGSLARLENSQSVEVSFLPDMLGEYEIELVVNDGRQTSKDIVRISSNNVSPLAQAGVDQLVDLGSTFILNASSSYDLNIGDTLNYEWFFERKPVGSLAEISNSSNLTTSFVVDKLGDYEVGLRVSDGVLSSIDRLVVSTKSVAPTVEIVTLSTPTLSQPLDLSAEVTHSDENITYRWSILTSPSGQLNFSENNVKETTLVLGEPGLYVIQLTVDNGEKLSQDTLLLNVFNQVPLANAGFDIADVITKKLVHLSGSGSLDPEGQSLTYKWTMLSQPTDSMSLLGDSQKEEAFFWPDKVGVYTLSLVVSDGFFESLPDTVIVTVVTPPNSIPVLGVIGNKTVDIGDELGFKVEGTDADVSDSLRFMISPLPLPENITFNSITGELFFKPRSHQFGTYNLTFMVIDKLGASDSEDIVVTVNELVEGASTTLSGQVLDANSMAVDSVEIPLVGANIKIVVDGNDVYSTTTDSNGNFSTSNLPSGVESIIQIETKGVIGPEGSKYGDFHEQIEVIEGVSNIINRPFYMPRVDPSGTAMVSPSQDAMIQNTNIGVEMSIPANTAMMDGEPFTGEVSISQVPGALAPVVLPESLRGTAMLITIQPAGLRFTTPRPITFPNIDNFEVGTEVNIFSVNPDTGLFEVSGRGRVTVDGSKIETISGGVTAATWHTLSPPGPAAPPCDDCINPPPEPPDEDCATCETGSSVDLQTGQLKEVHTLVSYRSLNQERSLTLGYSSQSLNSLKVINTNLMFPRINAIPPSVSLKVLFQGLSGTQIFSDSSILSENTEVPFKLSATMDLSLLETGIYKSSLQIFSHYTLSQFSAQFDQRISIVNYKDSMYGSGWSIVNLQRIYPTPEGLLLVSGNGFKSQFIEPPPRPPPSPPPLVPGSRHETYYLSPLGDYSSLRRVSNGGYIRNMKDGMTYKFDSSGLLVSESDRNGNTTTYCYNSMNYLKCIKDPNGMEYIFHYGGSNYLESITDPQGRVTEFEHDDSGNLVKVIDPDNSFREFSYDNYGLLVAQRDKRGNLTNYIYDDNFKVIKTVRSEGVGIGLSSQESMGLTTGEGEGTENNPLSLILEGEEEATYIDYRGNTSQFQLSERGQFTKIVDPLGRITELDRNPSGEVLSRRTARGNQWDYTYDRRGNMTSMLQRETGTETHYTYEPTFSQVTSITRPNGETTRFEYDPKGNLIKLILPDNSFYTFTYNKAGLIKKIINPLGQTSYYFYDRVSGNLIAFKDSLDHTTNFKLDAAGNVIQIKDPNGHIVRSEYDSLNRLIKSYDAENGETVYEYNAKGNLLSLTDSRDQTTTHVYDLLDRLVERTNPLGQSDYFTYDEQGNLIRWTNRKGMEARYIYDSSSQLVKKVLGDENTYVYQYDRDGNLIAIADDDSMILYEYDGLNRVVMSSTEGSLKQPAIIQRYNYDANGNRTRLRASYAGLIDDLYFENTYQYDSENQLTDILSLAGHFQFTYDDLSRVMEMEYPNGTSTTLSYEGDSRLAEVHHRRGSRTQSLFRYRYDEANNRTQMKTFRGNLPINANLDYTYDKKNQLTVATNPLQGQANENFAYDPIGNRLTSSGQVLDSVYNTNNQLLSDDNYTYIYDMNGNLVQKVHKTTQEVTKYKWDIENQLIQVTKHSTESALPSEVITYVYDGLGRRIEKNVNGKIRGYIYDNQDILFDFNENGILERFYVHGPGVDEALALVDIDGNLNPSSGQELSYYYHRDGLGSVTSLTDNFGYEKVNYIYDSFGSLTAFDDEGSRVLIRGVSSSNENIVDKNPFTFTGREYDAETGLYYYRARYYNPETGTFISEDPIGLRGGDPNLYRYVGNNPINLVDPHGQFPESILEGFECYVHIKTYENLKFNVKRNQETIQEFQRQLREINQNQNICSDPGVAEGLERSIRHLEEVIKGQLGQIREYDEQCSYFPSPI